MTEKAGIVPYLTNHSLRAATVTVLSASNIETHQIKAIRGHKSDSSIKSYVKCPTLEQFKKMSTSLTSFIQCEKSTQSTETPTPTDLECPYSLLNVQSLATIENENLQTSPLGLNSGSLLASGTFNNCQLTINVNVNRNY